MDLADHFPRGLQTAQLIARAVICGALLALASCRIPEPRSADPGPPLPATYNGATSPESSAQLPIEEFFNDPHLVNLIHQALTSNQELKILAEDIRIANNEVLLRRGAYLPFVSLRAGASVDRHSKYTLDGATAEQLEYDPGKHFPRPLPDFLVAANVSWEVDIWRRLRNARDAAALRYLATAEGRNYVVTRVVAEIAERYYTLMALDKRLETLDQTITLQQQSLEIAKAKKAAGRGTELAVQRFEAEVRKNQSEKLIISQEIVEAENRINFLAGRYPQQVERSTARFFDLNVHLISTGVPAQLLQNRPDIRRAEREMEAAGLEVQVARAEFYPRLDITGGVGLRAFNPHYLFYPEAFIANAAGDLVAPLVNRRAIQAAYMTANARQLQSVYDYQRVILDAFTEVINRVSMAENYRRSIEIKKQQIAALEASVDVASQLFQNARAEYSEVLFAQRDMLEARMVLIETKRQQLSAIVYTYQALGGGYLSTNSGLCTVLDAAEPPNLLEDLLPPAPPQPAPPQSAPSTPAPPQPQPVPPKPAPPQPAPPQLPAPPAVNGKP